MTEPIIDYEILAKLEQYSSPEDDLVKTLIEDFKTTYPISFEDFIKHFAAGDTESFGNTAHGLKSVSASLGMARVRRLCQELEDVRALNEDVRLKLIHLKNEIAAALNELSKRDLSQV